MTALNIPAVSFRWLGVAGLELAVEGQVLAVDPFFTRPPLYKLFTPLQTNQNLVAGNITRIDTILVTHPHYDHLMDIPTAARLSAAHVYASSNACRLLSLMGLPDDQVHPINVGDRFSAGSLQIQVFSANHITTPLDRWLNGTLPKNLRLPLRSWDYKMDKSFAFLVSISDFRLLVGDQLLPADVWFTYPLRPLAYYRHMLASIQPRLIVPIHWDDFFRRISKPVKPMRLPSPRFPFLSRIDLSGFNALVEQASPETSILVPEWFRTYSL